MDDPTQITYIGKVDHRNKMTKFGIRAKDRTKHMYIIGKTGTGKSTFLENMIVQDIQNGNGIAFIDPHGGSAQKLLDYIPEWRLDDVIYFDPSDFQFPIAFNPLEDPGVDKRHLVADGLMSVFKKVWPDAFSGRMEYILNNTMLSLLEYPDSTILSINRMLTDKDFRKRVVAATTDAAVRNAWDELMKWDDKRWSEAVAALINKVGQFSTNPVIRNIVGQPKSTFDFRKAMDERKIVIINLSKGMIGEQNAPLLGAMLITKIYLAAMSRAEFSTQVIEKMPPFYFYVDEFQNFANESFASILSEARKYKLALTVANQFIAQMEETIRDAVFGNMGSIVSFRVGPLDAEFMERVFTPVFTQEDLQNIQFGQCYLTLQIDNMGSKPFSAQGLGPIAPQSISLRNQVIESSQKNYGRPKEEVEAAINSFFGYDQSSAKVIASVSEKTPAASSYQSDKKPYQQKPSTSHGAGKTFPAVSGYSKPVREKTFIQEKSQTQASFKSSKPISIEKQSEPVSSTLSTLLNQLDDAVSEKNISPQVTEIKKSEQSPQELSEQVIEKKQEPVISSMKQSSFTSGTSFKKDLDRAASPEKKSALQEALAKALGSQPAPLSQPSPSAQPEKQTQELKSETTASVASVIELENPTEPIPTPKISQQSSTVREVPEDILRSVLE